VHTEFWWRNLREREHFEHLGIDERITLKLMCKKSDAKASTGLIWLRILTLGGL
jgi:hypothetical protein